MKRVRIYSFVVGLVFCVAILLSGMAARAPTATSQVAKATSSAVSQFRSHYKEVPDTVYAQYTHFTPLIDNVRLSSSTAAQQMLAAAQVNPHPNEAAVMLHDFVRDSIAFGWASAFHDRSASQVLQDKKGFCLSKSTLFTALLRSIGIPARVVFVDISTDVLHGILGGGQRFVDHSYVEVLLPLDSSRGDNADSPSLRGYRWVAVDSFVVDKCVHDVAQARLAREGRVQGYGVHRAGTSEWDGHSDAMSQFVAARGSEQLTAGMTPKEFEALPSAARFKLDEFPETTSSNVQPIVYEDAAAFYRDALQGGILPAHLPRVPMAGFLKFFFGWVVWPANIAVEKLRAAAMETAGSQS